MSQVLFINFNAELKLT